MFRRQAFDLDPEHYPHGTRARYARGCRCAECRTATNAYNRRMIRERKITGGNPYVRADAAREHLSTLGIMGVGLRACSDACDVPTSTLHAIRRGKRLHLRRHTEARILSVTADARADSAVVPSTEARRMLTALMRRGYTAERLARLLGSRADRPCLNILARPRITVRNAHRVACLYRRLTPKHVAIAPPAPAVRVPAVRAQPERKKSVKNTVAPGPTRRLIEELLERAYTRRQIEQHIPGSRRGTVWNVMAGGPVTLSFAKSVVRAHRVLMDRIANRARRANAA